MTQILPPPKPRNSDRRKREHLTPDEVDKLIKTAKDVCRNGERDSCLILMMFRHGLRVSEVINLTWDQLDLERNIFHVHRLKRGTDSTHPLSAPETRLLRKLQKKNPGFEYVFVSERKTRLTDSTVRKMVATVGQKAGITFPIHPHMLRHATGYKLANDGQDTRAIQLYLGHKNIQHTVRYTELASDRFKRFWKD